MIAQNPTAAASTVLEPTPTATATADRRAVDRGRRPGAAAAAELEFMRAMRAYKLSSGRQFPTWSETLEVLKGLGYEKPAA